MNREGCLSKQLKYINMIELKEKGLFFSRHDIAVC